MDAVAQTPEASWIPTVCGMCYIGCGVRVQVKNGVVVNIEGNPDNPQNRGKMCARGKAGVWSLYNPNRVQAPLRADQSEQRSRRGSGLAGNLLGRGDRHHRRQSRTHPRQSEKALGSGLGTRRRQQLLAEVAGHRVRHSAYQFRRLAHLRQGRASGRVLLRRRIPSATGSALLPTICILVGTQFGIATRGSYNHNALDMAEARERGMKLVSVDPVGGYAASKANEWIPIRPGTDAALALSMLHVLLNELHIYDEHFLKHQDQRALPGRRRRTLSARSGDAGTADLRRGRRHGQGAQRSGRRAIRRSPAPMRHTGGRVGRRSSCCASTS